jgi:radical SAM protein with 4Fe4S-binding SPASM domain
MAALVAINDKYGGRIGAQAGPLSRARMMKDITERLSRGETFKKGRGMLCSCGGVFNKMAVLHDGTFVPCNMLPTLVMGRIGETSLKEAWQTHPNINIVRERRKIPITEIEECAGCEFAGFCTGGCPGTVMSKTGKLDAIDPLVCYKRYLEEEAVDSSGLSPQNDKQGRCHSELLLLSF